MNNEIDGLDSRAAIILAGGDGTRLLSLTRLIAGKELPKQFCSLDGTRTLLDYSLDRALLAATQDNTVVVLNKRHRHFYQPLTRGIPVDCLIEQSTNRGTTPAILHAAIRIEHRLGRDAIVTVFPSDHYVDNHRALIRHVDISACAIRERPNLLILLGVAPSYPEASYGWIQPAEQIGESLDQAILRVRRFWEKPMPFYAEKLWLGGCFWNSFVFTVKIGFLLDLIKMHLPKLHDSFTPVINTVGSPYEEAAAAHVFGQINSSSFSEEVLAKSTRFLAVRPVNDLEWSDLGEPRRVYRTVKLAGWNPPWLKEPRGVRELAVSQLAALSAS